ncbi:SusC/RagA family TonB-linked outer membrane protein [Flavisolibacter nicotianae]|uniref:SusC/RagA family TonB-linked outer membrane protein n=1 Tax=Flavisolibacter nicotianae TaxID=2364882 RepID=UPI000EB1D099|nr:SusC/RagA family TonB-linked outer membrane protein [Flavisolibacter nicotianae]
MKKKYAPCKGLLPLTMLLFTGIVVIAQPKISGIVRGAEGLPLAGVTIAIQGTPVATSSAADGSFSILAKKGDVLIFSTVGREKAMVKLLDQVFLNISLPFNSKSLEDVVIIGYGTSQKRDLTGAVAKITAGDFNKGNVTDPLQLVQGKIAGLLITKPGGDPNGELTVRIRGATSLEGQPPLVVIDGMAIDDFYKAISTLNPADVESFTVLKDASSAAIYGSRGANGVLLITTKTSRIAKPVVAYDGWCGVEQISRRFQVLNASQWRAATAALGGASLDQGADMDWQSAISQRAFSHSHTISIRGGTDAMNYRGSMGYINQEGVIINTGKEVMTGRLNIHQKSLNEKLAVDYNINASVTNRTLLFDQWSTGLTRTGGSFTFDVASGYLPVWPSYNPDGSYFNIANNSYLNPLFLLKEIDRKQRENFFQTSVKADYTLLKGLNAGILGALSRANTVHDYFYPGVRERNDKAEASKFNNNKQNFSGDIHVHYQKSFRKQTAEITGVYEYNRFINDGFGVTARGFLVPQLLNNNLGTATNVQTGDLSSYKNEVKLISFLGRLVYTYDNRIIFTANFRRDGSSKFGSNNRWGNFPSFAFAWRLDRAGFLKNSKWLNDLKLRVSYGFTGNQENLPPYAYQQLYGPTGPYLYNGQVLQSYAVVQEPNPDLKWEVRRSLNIGADFTLFNDRLHGTIDVFHDKTSDMLFLYDLPQPPFLSDKVSANAATATNKGTEVTLDATPLLTKNWKWDLHFNIGTLKNRITNLSGQFNGTSLSITNRHYGYAEGAGFSGTYVSELKPGYPAGVFWLPQFAGLDADGHALYNNYDGNGKLSGTSMFYTDKDRVFIDPTPRFSWGFTTNLTYKRFDLSFFLRGVQGQKIFANSLLNLGTSVFLPARNVGVDALTNGFADQPQPSSYWVKDGSFVRLDNVTAGYRFKGTKDLAILRLYVTASNLLLLTKYKGIDPEIRTEGAQRYIDNQYYPKTKGFLLGVNMAF